MNAGSWVTEAFWPATTKLRCRLRGKNYATGWDWCQYILSNRHWSLRSAFGAITEVELNGQDELIVDNGHVVAWQETLSYTLRFRPKILAECCPRLADR